MSEYQYYEFQTIDRPLTEEEREIIGSISSRTYPSRTKASFVYHYTGFPRDEKEILGKYFDAMFYIANWGTTKLMFRFPKELIDRDQIQPYCVEYSVNFFEMGDYVLIGITRNDEEGYGWLEDEGELSMLITLRDDILQGDHRLLYLAWLKGIEQTWELDEETPEPPVPAGLGQLNPALESFVDIFAVNPFLLQAARSRSQTLDKQSPTTPQLRYALDELSEEEITDYLIRLAQGEPALSAKLNKHLREIAGIKSATSKSNRSAGELLTAAEQAYKDKKRRTAKAAERARIKRLKKLAAQKTTLWEEAEALVRKKNSKYYDEAVKILIQLQEVAEFQQQESAFYQKAKELQARWPRLSALKAKMEKARLI